MTNFKLALVFLRGAIFESMECPCYISVVAREPIRATLPISRYAMRFQTAEFIDNKDALVFNGEIERRMATKSKSSKSPDQRGPKLSAPSPTSSSKSSKNSKKARKSSSERSKSRLSVRVSPPPSSLPSSVPSSSPLLSSKDVNAHEQESRPTLAPTCLECDDFPYLAVVNQQSLENTKNTGQSVGRSAIVYGSIAMLLIFAFWLRKTVLHGGEGRGRLRQQLDQMILHMSAVLKVNIRHVRKGNTSFDICVEKSGGGVSGDDVDICRHNVDTLRDVGEWYDCEVYCRQQH